MPLAIDPVTIVALTPPSPVAAILWPICVGLVTLMVARRNGWRPVPGFMIGFGLTLVAVLAGLGLFAIPIGVIAGGLTVGLLARRGRGVD